MSEEKKEIQNSLVTVGGSAVAPTLKYAIDWTPEQVDLIKSTVAKGTNDDEFKLFLYQSRKTGLDPLAKQIHAIMRWNKSANRNTMSIQTGIDGYRLIADRTGAYAGSDEPKFIENKTAYPVSCSVTVYKVVGGIRCPFTAVAFWNEYFPGDNPQGFFWKKMPHGQLAKCAEALALRKAFPAELSGVYTHEEMQQAGEVNVDYEDVTVKPKVLEGKKTEPQKVEKPKAEPKKKTAKEEFLEKCESTKKWLSRKTGQDDSYFAVLGQFGCNDANEIQEKDYAAVLLKYTELCNDILNKEKKN